MPIVYGQHVDDAKKATYDAIKDKLKATGEKNAAKFKLASHENELWAIPMPEKKRELVGHLRKVQVMSWHSNSENLIACDQGGKVIIWDAVRNLKQKVLDKTFVMAATIHPEGKLAFVGAMDNLCHIYDITPTGHECKLLKQIEQHDGYVGSVAFPAMDKCLTSGGDAEIVHWDLNVNSGKTTFISRFYGHVGDATCIRMPEDKKTFCTGSCDKTLRVWDISSGQQTHLFELTNECNATAYWPCGNLVAAACHDGNCMLFDMRSYGLLSKMGRKNNRVAAVDISKSGRIIYCAYEDGHVGLWDTFGSGGYKQKLAAHADAEGNDKIISACTVSPDGQALATAAFDSKIRIWGKGK